MSQQNPPPGKEQHSAEDALAQHRDTLKELFPLPEIKKPRKKKTAANATLLLAMIAAGLLWLDPAYRSEQHATVIGQRADITLADDSKLTLNTDTQVEVSWHLRSRRVALHQGQALFSVAKAIYRPFTVAAGKADIKVVGTVFDVYRHPDHVTVTVEEGKVQVTSKAASGYMRTMLTANQQATISADGTLQPARDVNPASSLAWREGKLVFEQTPLSQAIAEIQRYRRGLIHLQAPALGNLRFSGVFAIDNTDKLLQLLPDILPVNVEEQEDGSLLISKK
ncbi:FecR family protein [Methylobacillus flagellatus]|uniref:FecR family protein n=1 Tax=Methylobacillus flagellatus TaxID=405 RepID=UPI00285387D8|nr:FecR family protein [Methylobacillus flagellatus]MDR5170620.1 FecR family protein [Methylobacillus flagellatus]